MSKQCNMELPRETRFKDKDFIAVSASILCFLGVVFLGRGHSLSQMCLIFVGIPQRRLPALVGSLIILNNYKKALCLLLSH